MSLEVVLPFGEKKSVKNLVFSILTHEYPLKLIELTNYIKKRYGLSVTFQAVRKAVMQLVEAGVLEKIDTSFKINTSWVRETKKVVDSLHQELTSKRSKEASLDSIGSEVSVFTFDSLNALMKFWQQLINHWFENFKKGDYPYNYYQGAHTWEGLLHLDTEEKIMGQLKQKGIQSYSVTSGNFQLDKNLAKFYNSIGVKTTINASQSSFDKSYYVATYGDFIVQTTYSDSLVKDLDYFFKKNTSLEDLDLTELTKIANAKNAMKLTVIKNLEMAKQINKSIEAQFLD